MTITANQIKAIHILLKEYNINDITYRDMLYRLYDCVTCKELNYTQADDLIHQLNYKYNADYKRGYLKGIDKFIDDEDNLTVFKRLISFVENRETTTIEDKMFEHMNHIQQGTIITSLREQLYQE